MHVGWGNAQAGAVSSMRLSLQCAMPIEEGERVEVAMKGFAIESLISMSSTIVPLAGVVQHIATNSSSESYTSTASRRLLNHEPAPVFKPARVLWYQVCVWCVVCGVMCVRVCVRACACACAYALRVRVRVHVRVRVRV